MPYYTEKEKLYSSLTAPSLAVSRYNFSYIKIGLFAAKSKKQKQKNNGDIDLSLALYLKQENIFEMTFTVVRDECPRSRRITPEPITRHKKNTVQPA